MVNTLPEDQRSKLFASTINLPSVDDTCYLSLFAKEHTHQGIRFQIDPELYNIEGSTDYHLYSQELKFFNNNSIKELCQKIIRERNV